MTVVLNGGKSIDDDEDDDAGVVLLLQNASSAAVLAKPPAVRALMFIVALSALRRTSYSGPEYAAYNERTTECAATHGVPPAARMSQGRAVDALPGSGNSSSGGTEKKAGRARMVWRWRSTRPDKVEELFCWSAGGVESSLFGAEYTRVQGPCYQLVTAVDGGRASVVKVW
jgi:hypothetical protein